MTKQLPMATEPSKTPTEHVMTNLLNCFTFVDVEKQLVIAYPVFLHLGYTKESVHAALSKPMLLQYTNCKGFVPREDYYISISQIRELIVNAPRDKYIPHILEFVKNVLTPLFSQATEIEESQPDKHSHKFHSDLFGDLTVLTHDDGSLWFIGKEVAEKLGYNDPNCNQNALQRGRGNLHPYKRWYANSKNYPRTRCLPPGYEIKTTYRRKV